MGDWIDVYLCEDTWVGELCEDSFPDEWREIDRPFHPIRKTDTDLIWLFHGNGYYALHIFHPMVMVQSS